MTFASEGEDGPAAAVAVPQMDIECLTDDGVADCHDVHAIVGQIVARHRRHEIDRVAGEQVEMLVLSATPRLRISHQAGQRFRAKLDRHFTRRWARISRQAGQRFHAKLDS
ncbi:hypothetical protein ACTJLC_29110, partial [Paraburkholderia sp. 22099]|uniref:hypothetical protein n=1 Tax=Paraburkholderia sp. 22099 TaxID=3453875 RepID=UPI003F83C917